MPALYELGAAELARRIATRELGATEVVQAHVARIEELHAALNAVVVPLFDQALEAARAVDRGGVDGPLAGVPFTAKDSFDVAGAPTAIGVVARAERRAARDAKLVGRLRRAGAILLGKTNVPQLCISYECANPLHGRSCNPWRLDRTPGGSSGGESAVVASGGSPLGLGSDGGGSVRWPAHCCGLVGFKPTSGLLSMEGHVELPCFHPSWLSPGLLARSVEDVELGLAALTAEEPAHARRSDALDASKLRFGFFVDDGFFTPAPAIRRATAEAARFLAERGARVEAIAPPSIPEVIRLYTGLLFADGGDFLEAALEGSAADAGTKRMLAGARLPRWVVPILAWQLRWLGRSPRLAVATRCFGRRSAKEVAQLEREMERFRSEFAASLAGFDGLLLPPHAVPAPPHGGAFFCGGYGGAYAYLFNLLDWPAGVVPATRVRESEESERARSLDPSEREARASETGSAGLPIGVQIAAPRGREDVVLATLKVLEAHFSAQPDFPRTPVRPAALGA